MLFPVETTLVATHLAFRRPVIILGPMGSGKNNLALEAMKVLPGGNEPGRLNYIQFDFLCMKRDYSDHTLIGQRSRWHIRHDRMVENNPDRVIYYSNIEYMPPEWVCKILELMMFGGRQVVMTGTHLSHLVLANRCGIVRL